MSVPAARPPQKAAVLVAIVAHEEPALLLIRRPGHMRRHAGQVACPGGIYEEGDVDLAATALRETEEELGIARQAVRIVRRLPEVFTLVSNVLITPFVGVIAPPLQLRADPGEIADVYEIPLRALRAKGAVAYGAEVIGGHEVATWVFDYNDIHVWGATGRILHEFVDLLDDAGAEQELEQAISLSRRGVD